MVVGSNPTEPIHICLSIPLVRHESAPYGICHMGFFICPYVYARYMCLLRIFALSLRAMTVVIGPGVYVTDNLVDNYVDKSTPEPRLDKWQGSWYNDALCLTTQSHSHSRKLRHQVRRPPVNFHMAISPRQLNALNMVCLPMFKYFNQSVLDSIIIRI